MKWFSNSKNRRSVSCALINKYRGTISTEITLPVKEKINLMKLSESSGIIRISPEIQHKIKQSPIIGPCLFGTLQNAINLAKADFQMAAPNELVGRGLEVLNIYKSSHEGILNGKGTFLYISGLHGTGKSTVVEYVVEKLKKDYDSLSIQLNSIWFCGHWDIAMFGIMKRSSRYFLNYILIQAVTELLRVLIP
jgi:hypothetical protein